MTRALLIRRLLMILSPLAVLVLGAVGAWTMIASREEPEKKPVEVQPPLVSVMEVKPETVQLSVQAEGTVMPRTASDLVPEVAGRVIWVSDSLVAGGFFEAGEDLIRIDPREYDLAVIRAHSAIAQAKLRLATEEQEAAVALKEWQSLGEGEATDLTLRKPQIAEAQAALAAAEAALQQARDDLERTVIRAPYRGRVRSEQVDPGQFVSRGASVASVYAVDVAEVRLPVSDNELAFLDVPLAYRGEDDSPRGGDPRVVLRTNFGGKEHSWEGRIVRTEGEIDPRTQMIHLVAQVNDPYGRGNRPGRPPLAVGMFVNAEIRGNSSGRVFVLPRSVMRAGNQVMVVDNESRLSFRPVGVLRAEGDRVLVSSGLEAGDRVIVSAVETAVNGMRVRVASGEGKASDAGASGDAGVGASRPAPAD